LWTATVLSLVHYSPCRCHCKQHPVFYSRITF